jgi:hypothetical protein
LPSNAVAEAARLAVVRSIREKAAVAAAATAAAEATRVRLAAELAVAAASDGTREVDAAAAANAAQTADHSVDAAAPAAAAPLPTRRTPSRRSRAGSAPATARSPPPAPPSAPAPPAGDPPEEPPESAHPAPTVATTPAPARTVQALLRGLGGTRSPELNPSSPAGQVKRPHPTRERIPRSPPDASGFEIPHVHGARRKILRPIAGLISEPSLVGPRIRDINAPPVTDRRGRAAAASKKQ